MTTIRALLMMVLLAYAGVTMAGIKRTPHDESPMVELTFNVDIMARGEGRLALDAAVRAAARTIRESRRGGSKPELSQFPT